MRRTRDPESLELMRRAAEEKKVYNLKIIGRPNGTGGINILREEIPLAAPWQMPIGDHKPPIGQVREIVIQRFVRKFKDKRTGKIMSYEIFLAFPANPEKLAKGEFDMTSQRYLRARLEIGRNNKPIIRYKDIVFKAGNFDELKTMEWWKFVGREIEISVLLGTTGGVFFPKYDNLGASEQITLQENTDKIKGIIHIVDVDNNRLRIHAISILNLHMDDTLDATKINSVWKQALIAVQNSDKDPIQMENGILAMKEEVIKAVHSAKDSLLQLLGKNSTSFRQLLGLPSDYLFENGEEAEPENTAEGIANRIAEIIEEKCKNGKETGDREEIIICALPGCDKPIKKGKFCNKECYIKSLRKK